MGYATDFFFIMLNYFHLSIIWPVNLLFYHFIFLPNRRDYEWKVIFAVGGGEKRKKPIFLDVSCVKRNNVPKD